MPERERTRPKLRLLGLAILLALALAGCADRTAPPQPSQSATPTPTILAQRSPTTSPPSPTRTAPGPDAPPTAGLPATATPLPTESPWPAFLQELDYGIPAGNSYGPRSLAVHPDLGRVYVRSHVRAPRSEDPGQVTVLDLASGDVLAIAKTGLDTYAEGELSLDIVRDRLYAVNAGDTTCTVLDAASLETVATIDSVEHLALDPDAGHIYVAGLSRLRILAAQDFSLLREVAVGYAPHFLALAVDPAGRRLFAIYRDGGDLVLSVHDAQTLELRSSRPLPGPPDDLVADARHQRAYLTLDDGQDSLLWVVDGDGELVEEQRLGDWTLNTTLALSADRALLFVGREEYQDNGVALVDTDTLEESADILLDQAPNALAWDPASQQLVASQTYINRIAILDTETAELSTTYPTAVNLVDVAVDPELGSLYITDTTGRLHVLDSRGGAELGSMPGEGYIAVDSAHGRVYVGGDGARQVRIFSASAGGDPPLEQTGTIQTRAMPVADAYHGGLYLVQNGIYLTSLDTLTITTPISDTLPEEGGFSPNPRAVDAVVDPGSGRIFAIINNGVPGSNNGNYLYVYEPETFERILADAERSATWVDIDPHTGRAYVGRIYMTLSSTSLLVDGREYSARLDSLSGPLRVDPRLGKVYLSSGGDAGGHLLVLDAETLDILGAIPTPAGLALRALDPERHLLYFSAGEGRLQIWSARGGELPGPTQPGPAALPVEQVQQLTTDPLGRTLFAGSLYRSDDEGRGWFQIGTGLPGLGIAQVVPSPEFAQDQTVFAVTMSTDAGLGIWRSTDGGRTWRMADDGLSDMGVTDLAISPAFGQDQTLFATTRHQGLFRSTDSGQTWVRLTGRYYQPEGYVEPAGQVVLSPTYAQDQTLFVAHDGLYRSADGGDSWKRVFAENPASLALSANLVDDGLVYGWFGSAGLLRSEDRGDTWQPVSDDLPLQGFGSGRVLLQGSEDGSSTVYFLWMPSAPDLPGQYFRSQDGAVTWEHLVTDLGPIVTPVQLDPQGTAFIALDADGVLVRWHLEELDWQPVGLLPVSEIEYYRLIASTAYVQDHVLYAVSEGSGILRSQDAGLTWESTGFPLRVIFGGPPELILRPPDTLLVGTELGLYRWQLGGPWHLSDGLPAGMAVDGPLVAPDGSLAVLVGAGTSQPQVYLSTDEGASWTRPVPALPYPAILEDLFLSPAFGSDHTAFLTGSREPLRSLEGGAWEVFGPPGASNLSAFDLSPAFDQDGLLFMRLYDNRFWRSTDRGGTWEEIRSPWGAEAPMGVTPGPGYRLPAVTFSPDYRRDGVLLTRAGEMLYRSTDGGASWTSIMKLRALPEKAVFSPDYGQDGTIYLVQGQSLSRSTDRGASWRSLPPAPWPDSDEFYMQLSPSFARDATVVAWTMSGQIYRSADGGQTWSQVDMGLAAASIRQILFAPDYAQSRLLFVVPFGGGMWKQTGGGPLVPITASAASATPTAVPRPTPTQAACPAGGGPFQAVLEQTGYRLGCPRAPAAQVQMAAQPFEHGRMIWDSSTLQIYVLYDSGRWQSYADTWVEGVDPAYDPNLPPPPRQPQRGFGKVWREQLGGPEATIGWALQDERAVAGWRQPFDGGLLLWIDLPGAEVGEAGVANLLYDDGTWEGVPARAPE